MSISFVRKGHIHSAGIFLTNQFNYVELFKIKIVLFQINRLYALYDLVTHDVSHIITSYQILNMKYIGYWRMRKSGFIFIILLLFVFLEEVYLGWLHRLSKVIYPPHHTNSWHTAWLIFTYYIHYTEDWLDRLLRTYLLCALIIKYISSVRIK